MWSLETIQQINEKATELALAGRPERDALELCGIKVLGNTARKSPREIEEDFAKLKEALKGQDVTVILNKSHRTLIKQAG